MIPVHISVHIMVYRRAVNNINSLRGFFSDFGNKIVKTMAIAILCEYNTIDVSHVGLGQKPIFQNSARCFVRGKRADQIEFVF